MHDFTPISALVGGVLIGLSASLLLLSHGRIAGIIGIAGDLLFGGRDARSYRLWFVVGLLATGVAMRFVMPSSFGTGATPGLAMAGAAGLLVGVGTRMGGGCTSGHGVCGISRFSGRSLLATVTFIATGMLTVLIAHHVWAAR